MAARGLRPAACAASVRRTSYPVLRAPRSYAKGQRIGLLEGHSDGCISHFPYWPRIIGKFTVIGEQSNALGGSLGHEYAIEWILVCRWQVVEVNDVFAGDG